MLDDHGLAVALQRYVADYSKTHKIAVDLTLDGAGTCDLPPAVQLAALRIVQEALTNVVEHSAATGISIRVARSATGLRQPSRTADEASTLTRPASTRIFLLGFKACTNERRYWAARVC